MLMMATPVSAIDVSYNTCFNSTVLFLHTNKTSNITSWQTNETGEYLNCPFGCDNTNRACRPSPSFITMEAFIIFFAIAVSLLGIAYGFNNVAFGYGGAAILFFLGIILWQGVDMGDFVISRRNSLYVTAFSFAMVAVGLYVILNSAVLQWQKRKEGNK